MIRIDKAFVNLSDTRNTARSTELKPIRHAGPCSFSKLLSDSHQQSRDPDLGILPRCTEVISEILRGGSSDECLPS